MQGEDNSKLLLYSTQCGILITFTGECTCGGAQVRCYQRKTLETADAPHACELVLVRTDSRSTVGCKPLQKRAYYS